jgi:ABC-2 type transport system ATP-binding protein
VTDLALDVKGVTKRFGQLEALRGVNLAVPRGLLFGLVGPNGAGKSTLIKALVGSLRPTSGTVSALGLDPLRDRAALRQQIGYMPQAPALYQDLSARDNLVFFAGAHRTPDLARRVDEVLALTNLSQRADDPVREFSGGMQRRLSLAAAIVHRPALILLDEPTAAVDPRLRARFWDTFRQLAAQGTTLFISTHLMDEAFLCDQVALLRQGRIVIAAPPLGLLARGRTRLVVTRQGVVSERVIESRPEALAVVLHALGLSREVTAVQVLADSLESVVLQLFDEQDQDETAL